MNPLIDSRMNLAGGGGGGGPFRPLWKSLVLIAFRAFGFNLICESTTTTNTGKKLSIVVDNVARVESNDVRTLSRSSSAESIIDDYSNPTLIRFFSLHLKIF